MFNQYGTDPKETDYRKLLLQHEILNYSVLVKLNKLKFTLSQQA